MPSARRELHGIAEQIDENLPHPFRIAGKQQRAIAIGLAKIDVFGLGQRHRARERGGHDAGDRLLGDLHTEASRARFRDVQHVVDQRQQMMAGETQMTDVL